MEFCECEKISPEERAVLAEETIYKNVLSILAKDDDWYVRLNVAKSKYTSEDDLLWLSNDRDPDVREAAINSLLRKH